MSDESHLDRKYFIDRTTYNCPFCKRNNVVYEMQSAYEFDWSRNKRCHVYFVQCSSCGNTSMHLSFEEINYVSESGVRFLRFKDDIDIDSFIFFSHPTSFFVLDSRIPTIIRELVSEAEGCLKMNFLTGASACMRKAIYEFLFGEKAEGDDYQSRIKSLKTKHPDITPAVFDVLAHIQDMTSNKLHEQSWDKWDSDKVRLIIEALKAALYEVYVLPQEKTEREKSIRQLLEQVNKGKKL